MCIYSIFNAIFVLNIRTVGISVHDDTAPRRRIAQNAFCKEKMMNETQRQNI